MSILIPGAVRTPPPQWYYTPVQLQEWKASKEVDSWNFILNQQGANHAQIPHQG